MERVILLDNDVILKLAAYGLLAEACAVLQADSADVRVLPSAVHCFRKTRNLIDTYGREGLERAIAFADSATTVCDVLGIEERIILGQVERMDIGETLLIQSTKGLPSFLLVTGDKWCLIALAACAEAAMIHDRLRNRVVCFEEMIRALIQRCGLDRIRECVAVRDCDETIKQVFGYSEPSPADRVMDDLNSCIDHLARQVGAGWLHRLC